MEEGEKKKDEDEESQSDNSEEEKPMATNDPVSESKLFKAASKVFPNDDRRDQGFVRPKVLILLPFK